MVYLNLDFIYFNNKIDFYYEISFNLMRLFFE